VKHCLDERRSKSIKDGGNSAIPCRDLSVIFSMKQ
jgi:hypothetical protein